uniref:CSON011419 protein n=1 Tax=Culicoides sonorensis TaxID=179676 RepID=A0A336M608_CULSO
MNINWKELFPSRISVVIFILYMVLFVAQGILITASQNDDNSYEYNTVTVVLASEGLKLIISCLLFFKNHNASSLCVNLVNETKLLFLYLIPALLYCIYNNLAFLNLSTFDPTTYFILLQLRVVFTGILFQIIFNRKLTKLQWFSLVVLTIGCMIRHINLSDPKSTIESKNNISHDSFSMKGFGLIIIQTLCSCFAGVYNEYLLKKKGKDTDIYLQNIYMYIDSLACNILLLFIQGDFFSAFDIKSIKQILQLNVLIIICNNCAIGIVTSFFLKHMNSILKTFASALELTFTAVLSYFFLKIPLNLSAVISIIIVCFAIYFYSKSPVTSNSTILPIHSRSNYNISVNQKLLSSDDN